ncbi:MAG: helix-turn-helix transcriptional regulator [Planctomycetota bacterium]
MADRPSDTPNPGPTRAQAAVSRPSPAPTEAGLPSYADAGAAPDVVAAMQRGGRRPDTDDSVGPKLPDRAALAGLIAALDLEPAVGMAIVDAQARPLHANRRFGALTVPDQRGRAVTPEALAPRKGVWTLVGPDLVERVLAEKKPAVLRFIHDGSQVRCTVWPIEIGPDAVGATEPDATDRGPLLLVLAVEGPVEPSEHRTLEVPPSQASADSARVVEPKPGIVTGAPESEPEHDLAHGFITMSATLAELGPMSALTSRELEVLALIGEGYATREIAEALGRSPRTVERHCDAIHKKLGTTNRVQMARYAMRAGLTIEAGKLKRV